MVTSKDRCTLLVGALVCLFMAHAEARAANYYTDNSVSSSGNGSIGAPFRTIQEGLGRLGPGDVLFIRGNASGRVYTETPSFPANGTASQPITMKGYPGEKVILTGTSGSRMSLTKDYWIIDGITVDQANTAADCIKVNAHHVTIQNCEIMNGQREGISIEAATDVTIQDCLIHDFMWIENGVRTDAHCIMIDSGVSSTITGITIQRNTIRRCSGDGTQIFAETGQAFSTYPTNISFLNNTFICGEPTFGLTENALDFKAGDGVVVRGNTMTGYISNKTVVIHKGCRNINVENNTIRDGLSGLEMRVEGGSSFIELNNRVVGNLIYNMSSYGLKFDGLQNLTATNNTLAHIGAESFRFEGTIGVAVLGGIIKNNLVYDAGKPVGTSLLSGVAVDYNGWFLSNAGGLAGTHDISGTDPAFVNSAGGDFRLSPASRCINAGTPVGRPYLGSAPDLGAFEFNSGGSGDTTPPSATRDLRTR